MKREAVGRSLTPTTRLRHRVVTSWRHLLLDNADSEELESSSRQAMVTDGKAGQYLLLSGSGVKRNLNANLSAVVLTDGFWFEILT